MDSLAEALLEDSDLKGALISYGKVLKIGHESRHVNTMIIKKSNQSQKLKLARALS